MGSSCLFHNAKISFFICLACGTNYGEYYIKRNPEVHVTIYTGKISKQLLQDVEKHNAQYEAIAIKEFKRSHDRFLIIDDDVIYHFGASLKDLGKKWFAFSRFEKETVKLLSELD